MKIAERILWAMVALGVLMKVLHLPLAGLVLILSLSLVSMLYFLFSWLLFRAPDGTQVMVVSILAGPALSTAAMGMLFKIQVWPVSGFFLFLGIIGLAVLSIVLLAVLARHGPFARTVLQRTLPVLLACVVLYALPSATLLSFYYREDPEIERLMIRHHSIDDPEEREQIRFQIDSIQQARIHNEREQGEGRK